MTVGLALDLLFVQRTQRLFLNVATAILFLSQVFDRILLNKGKVSFRKSFKLTTAFGAAFFPVYLVRGWHVIWGNPGGGFDWVFLQIGSYIGGMLLFNFLLDYFSALITHRMLNAAKKARRVESVVLLVLADLVFTLFLFLTFTFVFYVLAVLIQGAIQFDQSTIFGKIALTCIVGILLLCLSIFDFIEAILGFEFTAADLSLALPYDELALASILSSTLTTIYMLVFIFVSFLSKNILFLKRLLESPNRFLLISILMALPMSALLVAR